MAKNAIKNLKKEDLLKMLKEQEMEIARLNTENEACRQQLEEARETAEQYERMVEVEALRDGGEKIIGSIADASIKVSGVFEAAQAAADKYLDEIRSIFNRLDTLKSQVEEAARAEADEIILSAKKESERFEQRKQEIVDEIWGDLNTRLDNYCNAHEKIIELLGGKPELQKNDILSRYNNE